MQKYQRPNQVNHPWYIPVVLTGKPNFGAPNCPVRALRYYHLIHDCRAPGVKEGQTLLVYSIQRQPCGEGAQCSLYLSLDLQHYPRIARVSQERSKLMRSVMWLLHYNFSTSRHTSCHEDKEMVFYLRDLCAQADRIQKTGPVVAAGEITEISSLVSLFLVQFVSSSSCSVM